MTNTKVISSVLFCVRLLTCQVYGQVQDNLLTKACQAFGKEEYATARSWLELHQTKNPGDAPLTYYYIGECYFQAGDMANAERWLVRAAATDFNKQESLWRLSQIASNRADLVNQQKYEAALADMAAQLEAARRAIVCWPPENPDGTVTLRMTVGSTCDGVCWAGKFRVWGCLEHAITQLECWEANEVPLEKRLRTERELFGYGELASYCEELAEKWRDENRDPGLIETVEMKARHYALKVLIVESRNAAGKLEKRHPGPPVY